MYVCERKRKEDRMRGREVGMQEGKRERWEKKERQGGRTEKEKRKEKRTKEGKEKPANPYLNITEE